MKDVIFYSDVVIEEGAGSLLLRWIYDLVKALD